MYILLGKMRPLHDTTYRELSNEYAKHTEMQPLREVPSFSSLRFFRQGVAKKFQS